MEVKKILAAAISTFVAKTTKNVLLAIVSGTGLLCLLRT